jgi:hypothetical protein
MFRKHATEIVLYLDTSNRLPNKALFDHLAESREAIERRYRNLSNGGGRTALLKERVIPG